LPFGVDLLAMGQETNRIIDGAIWKGILFFFFPVLLGTFFQQLYNTADAVIVGKALGKEALAAIGGGTSVIINLYVGFFTGLSSGISVVVSHSYGSGNMERARKAVGTGFSISLLFSLFTTIFGMATAKPFLLLVKTPPEIMDDSLMYMLIYFAGSSMMITYNIGSGLFRALGDSKHPLYFLIISCAMNIFLDILFVLAFHWGVAGACAATVISEAASATLTVVGLLRMPEVSLSSKYLRIDFREARKMMLIGLPAGLQSIMYGLSNIMIQAYINAFGTDTAAAWAAFQKIDATYWMVVNALGIAVTTFAGQNYGAGKRGRMKKAASESLLMGCSMAILISSFFYATCPVVYRMFTSDQSVLGTGIMILRTIVPFYISYVPIEVFSGTIRGAGKAAVPTFLCLFGICALRIAWLLVAYPISSTLRTVLLCYPITWFVTALSFALYYRFGKWLRH